MVCYLVLENCIGSDIFPLLSKEVTKNELLGLNAEVENVHILKAFEVSASGKSLKSKSTYKLSIKDNDPNKVSGSLIVMGHSAKKVYSDLNCKIEKD